MALLDSALGPGGRGGGGRDRAPIFRSLGGVMGRECNIRPTLEDVEASDAWKQSPGGKRLHYQMDSVPVGYQVGKPEIHRAKHSAPRSSRPAALRDERGAQEEADDGGYAAPDFTVLARADDAKGEPGAYMLHSGRPEILQGEVDSE